MGFLTRKETNVETQKTPQEIIESLKRIFKGAVGKDNGILMEDIYIEVFGKVDSNIYLRNFKTGLIHAGINYLKRTTNYFIVSESIKTARVYYVVSNPTEARTYKNKVNNKIKGLEKMKRKCDDVVENRKYTQLEDVNLLK